MTSLSSSVYRNIKEECDNQGKILKLISFTDKKDKNEE